MAAPVGRIRCQGSRPPSSASTLDCTVARLAADGLSNREIGQRLFLSHHTVRSHLYRIFPKLNVATRAQLASRLAPGLNRSKAVA